MDEQHSFINVALPQKKKKRQVVVAYSYRLYPKDDYRKIYRHSRKLSTPNLFSRTKRSPTFISFRRSARTNVEEVPSDLRDVDRVEYRSYSELEIALQRLLAQELPPPRPLGQKNFIDTLRENIMELLRKNPGLKIGDIPKAVEQTIDLTQVAIRPMIDVELRTTGAKRGTRYYVIE